jgi:hypothetical protein
MGRLCIGYGSLMYMALPPDSRHCVRLTHWSRMIVGVHRVLQRFGRDTAKSLGEAVTCGVQEAEGHLAASASGGRGPGGTMEVPTLSIARHEGRPPADDIFAHPGCPQPVSS